MLLFCRSVIIFSILDVIQVLASGVLFWFHIAQHKHSKVSVLVSLSASVFLTCHMRLYLEAALVLFAQMTDMEIYITLRGRKKKSQLKSIKLFLLK